MTLGLLCIMSILFYSLGRGHTSWRVPGAGASSSSWFRFRVSGFGFRVSGFGFRVPGLGYEMFVWVSVEKKPLGSKERSIHSSSLHPRMPTSSLSRTRTRSIRCEGSFGKIFTTFPYIYLYLSIYLSIYIYIYIYTYTYVYIYIDF